MKEEGYDSRFLERTNQRSFVDDSAVFEVVESIEGKESKKSKRELQEHPKTPRSRQKFAIDPK
jgi:hypothetical protein